MTDTTNNNITNTNTTNYKPFYELTILEYMWFFFRLAAALIPVTVFVYILYINMLIIASSVVQMFGGN